jgi:hypothetical protein
MRRQAMGRLSASLDSRDMLLAMVALTWFPVAFPQLTRLITGLTPSDSRFIRRHQNFLRQMAAAFHAKRNGRPAELASQINGRSKNVC